MSGNTVDDQLKNKLKNLKGIKFVFDEHGGTGKDRILAGVLSLNPEYYKSKRFQEVAEIINNNFLNKNKDNKLYFYNTACYGRYYFNEFKKNTDNSIPRSNHVYEILSNTLGENRKKVYCSQLIPESGLCAHHQMNSNLNRYRNHISYALNNLNAPKADEPFIFNDLYDLYKNKQVFGKSFAKKYF